MGKENTSDENCDKKPTCGKESGNYHRQRGEKSTLKHKNTEKKGAKLTFVSTRFWRWCVIALAMHISSLPGFVVFSDSFSCFFFFFFFFFSCTKKKHATLSGVVREQSGKRRWARRRALTRERHLGIMYALYSMRRNGWIYTEHTASLDRSEVYFLTRQPFWYARVSVRVRVSSWTTANVCKVNVPVLSNCRKDTILINRKW